jgi:hypothetical protein
MTTFTRTRRDNTDNRSIPVSGNGYRFDVVHVGANSDFIPYGARCSYGHLYVRKYESHSYATHTNQVPEIWQFDLRRWTQ